MNKTTSSLLAAAVSGLLLGSTTGCASDPATSQPSAEASMLEKHACKGLNSCRGQGGCAVEGKHACKGMNDCRGNGGCATVEHACKGQNDCRGQGGCKTERNACKGQNACQGMGGCKVPN